MRYLLLNYTPLFSHLYHIYSAPVLILQYRGYHNLFVWISNVMDPQIVNFHNYVVLPSTYSPQEYNNR